MAKTPGTSGRTYNNNRVYPMGGVKGGRTEKDTNYRGIQPAMKKGPAPADMGTTSGRAQTNRFYKGSQKGPGGK